MRGGKTGENRPDMLKLFTIAEVADLLRYTGRDRERSVRRLFERWRIPLLRRDRGTFLATEEQVEGLLEAMKCSPSASAAGSTTSVGRSVSVAKPAGSKSTLRAAIAARMPKPTELRLEHDVRHAMLHGAGGKAQGLTIADAGLLYMNRPGGLKSYDLWRLDQLNDIIGDYPIGKAAEGWGRRPEIRDHRPVPSTKGPGMCAADPAPHAGQGAGGGGPRGVSGPDFAEHASEPLRSKPDHE